MVLAGIEIELCTVDTLGGSPARCTIISPNKSARILLAKDKMKNYPKSTRLFVILHELGHAVLNSGDEVAVDRWAFKQFIKTKEPLSGAVFAVSKVLNPIENEDHSERVKRQFQRAKMISLLRGKTTLKQFQKQRI